MNTKVQMHDIFRGKKLISFLIPTRAFSNGLKTSLKSIYEKAENVKNIEVILRIDFDDYETLNEISNIKKQCEENNLDIIIIIGNRGPNKYYDVNVYYDECAALSTGDFLMPLNDDVTIITDKYDTILEKYKDKFCIIAPNNNHQIINFPILNRKVYDLINCFSPHIEFDFWCEQLFKAFPQIMIDLRSTLEVKHDHKCWYNTRTVELENIPLSPFHWNLNGFSGEWFSILSNKIEEYYKNN